MTGYIHILAFELYFYALAYISLIYVKTEHFTLCTRTIAMLYLKCKIVCRPTCDFL